LSSLNDVSRINGKREPLYGQGSAPSLTQTELAQRIAQEMLQADRQALEREIRAEADAGLAH
jgi:hypothetical protein